MRPELNKTQFLAFVSLNNTNRTRKAVVSPNLEQGRIHIQYTSDKSQSSFPAIANDQTLIPETITSWYKGLVIAVQGLHAGTYMYPLIASHDTMTALEVLNCGQAAEAVGQVMEGVLLADCAKVPKSLQPRSHYFRAMIRQEVNNLKAQNTQKIQAKKQDAAQLRKEKEERKQRIRAEKAAQKARKEAKKSRHDSVKWIEKRYRNHSPPQ